MKHSFDAKIYKVGINACVKVPRRITLQRTPLKGFIPLRGKIERFRFKQTLVPIKNAPYRLFVNGPMLKGASVSIGDKVHFTVEQDFDTKSRSVSMPRYFKIRLQENDVLNQFKSLTPSRQKEILKYLSYLKTEASRERNVEKVIRQLKSFVAS